MSPSDFWNLTPHEWWRIYELKRERDPENDYAGNLRECDLEEMYEAFL